jgi:hypothetical protein
MTGTACRYAPVSLAVPAEYEGKLVDGVAMARLGEHLAVSPVV